MSKLTFTLGDLKRQHPFNSVKFLYSKLPNNVDDNYKINLLMDTSNSTSDILWVINNKITKLSDKEIKIISVKVAIFSAELVLPIFEKKYPNDNRPRKTIEAAKSYLENPIAANAANAAADYANAAEIKSYLLTILKEYDS